MSDSLTDQMAQLNVGGGKKRRARAFHTDLMEQQPTFPGTAPTDAFPQMPVPAAHSPLTPQHQQMPIPQIGNTTGPLQGANGSFVPLQEATSEKLSVQEFRDHNHREYIANDTYTNPETGEAVEGQKQFLTFANIAPPDSTTQYLAVDQGTASAKFMRSTMYYVPETEQLRAATKLPLAVTIRPFAPLSEYESPVPVVDMRREEYPSEDPLDNGPIRCRRCMAYMNPSMQFAQGGNVFQCNICQFPNNRVPNDYNAMLDANNQRIDKFIRPELHRGVYDLMVPKEYNFGYNPTTKDRNGKSVEVPAPVLNQVFLVDISEASVRQGVPQVVADAIRGALYANDSPLPGKVSIIAFDKKVHFYNLSDQLDSTEVAIMPDLEDPVVPFYEGLFVDPEQSRGVIEDALDAIEQIGFAHDVMPDSEPCFASALKAASMALDLVGGGKITSILTALPTWGPGALKFKDNRQVGRGKTAEAEQALYLPDNEYWKKLGKDFHKSMVGLDVHVVAPAAVDLSHVGWLATTTGGCITRISDFKVEHDARKLSAHIYTSIRRVCGSQGLLKLRCSNGLQVTQYYGAYVPDGENIHGINIDPVIPTLNEDFTMTVLLQYDGKLSTKYDCHFQAALLYTDPEGIRKVRIINLVLAVTERLEEAFNFADENAVVTTIARDGLSFIGKQSLTEIRESVNLKLVEVFTQYRAMSELGHNRNRTLSSQLLFPESIQHLPQFFLSLIKTRAMRSSTSLSVDTRLEDLYTMINMPVERLMYHLYPALVELHSLQDDEGIEQNSHVTLPRFKDLSMTNIEAGIYLMCDGKQVFVWVDPRANPLLLEDVFGTAVVADLDSSMDELPEIDTEINTKAHAIIRFFNQFVLGYPSLGSSGIQLVRPEIDKHREVQFKENLVEDSLNGALAASSGPSYREYLTSLHKAIRDRLDNDKSSQKVRQSVSVADSGNETLAQRMMHF